MTSFTRHLASSHKLALSNTSKGNSFTGDQPLDDLHPHKKSLGANQRVNPSLPKKQKRANQASNDSSLLNSLMLAFRVLYRFSSRKLIFSAVSALADSPSKLASPRARDLPGFKKNARLRNPRAELKENPRETSDARSIKPRLPGREDGRKGNQGVK